MFGFFHFHPTGSAVDCYSCNSHEHIDCGEMFIEETSQLKPAPCDVFEGQYCIKTTGVFEGMIAAFRTPSPVTSTASEQVKSGRGDFVLHETMATTASTSNARETYTSIAAAFTPAHGMAVMAVFLLLCKKRFFFPASFSCWSS